LWPLRIHRLDRIERTQLRFRGLHRGRDQPDFAGAVDVDRLSDGPAIAPRAANQRRCGCRNRRPRSDAVARACGRRKDPPEAVDHEQREAETVEGRRHEHRRARRRGDGGVDRRRRADVLRRRRVDR
ncbi:MAG: hypothetical protein ACK56I_10480, partial [bacterium]